MTTRFFSFAIISTEQGARAEIRGAEGLTQLDIAVAAEALLASLDAPIRERLLAGETFAIQPAKEAE